MDTIRDEPDYQDDSADPVRHGDGDEDGEALDPAPGRTVVDEAGLAPGADDVTVSIGFNSHELTDDSVGMYLREIGQVALLTAAEERALSRQIEASRHLQKLEEEYFKKHGTHPSAIVLTVDILRLIVRGYPLLGACPSNSLGYVWKV